MAQAYGATAVRTGDDGKQGKPGQAGSDGSSVTAGVDSSHGGLNKAVAVGGKGGQGGLPAPVQGDGGHGGDARADASAHPKSGDARSSAQATGGDGGDAGRARDGVLGTYGGRGGSASASAASTAQGGATADAKVIARGGRGANGLNGGAGGGIGEVSARAVSGSGTARASVEAIGGDGGAGDAVNGGIEGGAGASVILSNTVSGSTTGRLALSQTVRGGNGGSAQSGAGGNGGNAGSLLSVTDETAQHVDAEARAFGGHADNGFQPGAAMASANVTGRQAVTVRAEAVSGDAVCCGATYGVAEAHAYGASTEGGAVTVSADVRDGRRPVDEPQLPVAETRVRNAVGGSTTGTLKLSQTARGGLGSLDAGIGGSAQSSLNVSDYEASRLQATVRAVGGAGGRSSDGRVGAGGSAAALLDLRSEREGTSVLARSRAIGGQGETAKQLGDASASSLAATQGYGARAVADSKARGRNATAESQSLSVATVNDRVRTVTTDAQAQSAGTARSITQTAFDGAPSYSGGGPGDRGALAYSFANATPAAARVNDALAGSPEVAASFAAQGLQPVGLGAMGASSGANGGTWLTAQVHYTFDAGTGSPVTLGLLGFSGRDAGAPMDLAFSVTNFDTLLVSQSFSSLSDAQAYFADNSLLLGRFKGDVDLQLSFSMAGAPSQTADFSYLLGAGAASNVSAVPEPATWALLVFGLGGLAAQARRRRRAEEAAARS